MKKSQLKVFDKDDPNIEKTIDKFIEEGWNVVHVSTLPKKRIIIFEKKGDIYDKK